MAPVARRTKKSGRQPLTSTPVSEQQNQIVFVALIEIFNDSQHVTTTDSALSQIKKLHRSTNPKEFNEAFNKHFRKFLQSKQSIYTKTTCEFICKFLQHLYKQSPDEDELIIDCIDTSDLYMQVVNDDCRLNAVHFISKFLAHVEYLDEEALKALKSTLPKLIRDKKPNIRAQAVLASRKFQDTKLTHDAFRFHFERDPELVVRKALLQIMETKVFGYDFLVDSTRDRYELMRKAAYLRLGKLVPEDLTEEQIHRVLHNGLNERERLSVYAFRTHTLEPWLRQIYDGLNLDKLLLRFNILDNYEDICSLLDIVYERDLEKMENNGTSTRLHHVVEAFREQWLNDNNSCLPMVEQIDEKISTIWFTLVKFCKLNQAVIKPVKIRTIPTTPDHQNNDDANESIERILTSQERPDEVLELYERLTPDLIHLVDFLKRFVSYAHTALKSSETSATRRLEFIYQQIMESMLTYEIGDEIERKKVQEVLGGLLKENLLTGKFENFIPPIVDCLFKLIYSSSSKLMINYIAELINNVRSHLEDLHSYAFTQPKSTFKQQHKSLHEPDASHMSMIIETDPPIEDGKFSSTMIAPNENSISSDSQAFIHSKEDLRVFKHHTADLIKCFQMYFACLQNVKIDKVPQTMLNHLMQLSLEGLESWFLDEAQVRSLVVLCNGITASIDERFAEAPQVMDLLISSCFEQAAIEIRSAGFKSLVDVVIQHQELDFPQTKVEVFLKLSLKEYGKYNRKTSAKNEMDFATVLVIGTTKLFYFRKIASPKILSQLILWWYHPMTDSYLRQHIGVFLPMFVKHLSKSSEETVEWLKELLEETFIESIKILHDYCKNEGYNILSGADIHSLMHFLSNLIPITSHSNISNKLEDEIDSLSSKGAADLIKYLKKSKNILTCETSAIKRPLSTDQ